MPKDWNLETYTQQLKNMERGTPFIEPSFTPLKSPVNEPLPLQVPERRLYGERVLFFRALPYMCFRFPGKRTLLPGSLHRERERDAPFPEPTIFLRKSPVNEPPYRFPKGVRMDRVACSQGQFLHMSWRPQ
jgi:hypothetical protein